MFPDCSCGPSGKYPKVLRFYTSRNDKCAQTHPQPLFCSLDEPGGKREGDHSLEWGYTLWPWNCTKMTGPLRGQTNKADLHPILSPVVPNPHQPPRLGWAELHFDVTWADPLLPTILTHDSSESMLNRTSELRNGHWPGGRRLRIPSTLTTTVSQWTKLSLLQGSFWY